MDLGTWGARPYLCWVSSLLSHPNHPLYTHDEVPIIFIIIIIITFLPVNYWKDTTSRLWTRTRITYYIALSCHQVITKLNHNCWACPAKPVTFNQLGPASIGKRRELKKTIVRVQAHFFLAPFFSPALPARVAKIFYELVQGSLFCYCSKFSSIKQLCFDVRNWY